jgi:cyclopropane-fatty-acyl-phospholipid synthase
MTSVSAHTDQQNLPADSAFRGQGHMNFQIQFAKRMDAVPLTRDYITDHDRTLSLV